MNDLSIALLGEAVVWKPSKKIAKRRVRVSPPPKLIYRGAPEKGPAELRWMISLLKDLFKGREITTNECEGTFGNMGALIRSGRSILLERALTKNMLAAGDPMDTVKWFSENHPMSKMGIRGSRGHRRKLIVGKSYEITYSDHYTVKTVRTIDIIQRKRKYIVAFCHLRNAERVFKRSKIQNIVPL